MTRFRRAPAMLAGASLVCLLAGLLYLASQIRTIFSDQLKQEYAGLVLEAAGRADGARAMVDVWRQRPGERDAQAQADRQARTELADRLGALAALVNASPAAAPHVPASALMPDASLNATDGLLATVSAYWRAQRDADGADVRLRIAHVANVLIALAALLFSLLLSALGMYAKRNRQLAGESYEFEYAALHDPMTGLPNRRKLFAALDEAAAKLQAGSAHRKIAVLYVDLDGFKQVNDSLGHHAGDEFLIAVSRRFRESVRKADVVARIGGDEFAVLIQEFSAADELAEIARRLIACVVATDRQMGLGLVRATLAFATFPVPAAVNRPPAAAATTPWYRANGAARTGNGSGARPNGANVRRVCHPSVGSFA